MTTTLHSHSGLLSRYILILPQAEESGKGYRAPNTFTIITDALKNWPGLNWTDRFIYARIERYQKQGRAFPSHQTLAREAGIKRGQALRICQKLKRLGLLKVERRRKEGTNRLTTCAYRTLQPWKGYVPETGGLKATEKIHSNGSDPKNYNSNRKGNT